MFILISAWTRRTGLAKSCTQNRHMMRNRYSSHFSFPNNSSTFNLSIPHFSWKIDLILFTILSIDSLILKRYFFYLSCPANQYLFHIFLFSKKTRLELWVCILGSISTNFFIKIMFSHFPILRYHPTLCNGSELSFGKFGAHWVSGQGRNFCSHLSGKFERRCQKPKLNSNPKLLTIGNFAAYALFTTLTHAIA